MINKLIRPELLGFKQYKPSPTLSEISREVRIPMGKIIKADSGENLYTENLLNKKILLDSSLNFYPDPTCRKLREKLGEYVDYPAEWIVCGNGSDELIDLLIRVFVCRNEEIIINPPTFPMYEFYGKLSGAKIRSVQRNTNFSVDIAKILRLINSKTKLIFIDSPGNPTSAVTCEDDIKKLLAREVIVVVDEAYYEYCGQTVLPLVKKYPNLIVLRTLSKWAGLAGLRIGYAVANPWLVDWLLRVKPPYNVNSIAQKMALYVLTNREKFLGKIKNLVKVRDETINKISRFPNLQVFPSQGAYILFRPKVAAQKVYEFLKKNGILVKVVTQPSLKNCLRVNLMDKKSSEKFIFYLMRFMKFDGIIFDMDGVIVDVSKSYREAIRQTASYFLGREVKRDEVDNIKSKVGMNNDWDATYTLINNKNISYNAVKDYFQSKYLGDGKTKGLMLTERLLISKVQFRLLKAKYYKLGIATGRPKKEALFVIKNFGLKKFFPEEFIVGMEETMNGKPSPDPLLEVKKRMRVKEPVYVGDMIDDVVAAEKAKMFCVFVGEKKLGDMQITGVSKLLKVLL